MGLNFDKVYLYMNSKHTNYFLKKISICLFEGFIRLSNRLFRKPMFKKLKTKKLIGKDIYIYISPDNGLVDQHIFMFKSWELDIVKFFIREFKKGYTFLDIGSNIGYYSLIASKLSPKKVFAFEPLDFLCDMIHKSIEKNNFKNIEVFNFGLGNKNSKEKIFSIRDNIGTSSIVVSGNRNEVREITIKKGDEIIKNTKVDFIKIDVEGFEDEVLKGLEKTIKKKDMPKIIIEFHHCSYKDKGKGILDFLFKLNYKILIITKNKYLYKKDIDNFLDNTGLSNLFCKK